MCAGAGISASSRLSPFLCPFWFWVIGVCLAASLLVLVRHFALLLDLKMYFDESCGIDVEDELVPELDDNPGTKKRNNVLPLFDQPWFFTAGPLISVSVFFAEFPK